MSFMCLVCGESFGETDVIPGRPGYTTALRIRGVHSPRYRNLRNNLVNGPMRARHKTLYGRAQVSGPHHTRHEAAAR
jgi:hypothetical protein